VIEIFLYKEFDASRPFIPGSGCPDEGPYIARCHWARRLEPSNENDYSMKKTVSLYPILKQRMPLFLFFITACFNVRAQEPAKAIDQLVLSYHNQHLFNGNVRVIQNTKTIFERSYGQASMELAVKNGPQTRFRIGSLTKQFTAALILQLRDEKKIDLDQNVHHYLPWLGTPVLKTITVHQLLNHTSGLPNYTDSAQIINQINSYGYSPQRTAANYFNQGPVSPPGTKFAYCNTGYFLLGLIIEELRGHQLR
jgi:CubicO group peptidase (beta-lactamase class C family)